MEKSLVQTSSSRFNSVDALRGLTVAAMLLVNNAGDWDHVYPWLEHATWHGCTPADFIFPFFLVIVGVSLHLALMPKMLAGFDQSVLARAVFWRGLRIIGVGLALHLIAYFLIAGREFRLMGVLQRIGLCFIVVGCLLIYVRSAFAHVAIFVSILLGYWGLLYWGGSLEPHLNMPDRVDTALLGSLAYVFNPTTGLGQEPEGILSSLPALASVLMGWQAGVWLRAGLSWRLCLAGVIAMLLGAIWSLVLPLNKQLWTSSFVLWTGGFALVFLAVAHYLIDRKRWPALGKSFGVNAIIAYAGAWIATCVLAATGWMNQLYPAVFVSTFSHVFGAEFSSLTFAVSFTAFFGVVMWVMRCRAWRFSI